ncbi:DsbA family protein (plasmid) [Leclercia pneumoniae]|uniref:DsbA family protein n=1 Tax=Leclercia pneumoniae TaxID=2815358 RepID=UPI0021E60461|nr:DsbA family protein [Leclercia pneumoniae]MCV2513349.1 DsbA family protein [Leclercia pneumoniae]WNN83791.1 DsbA family protein [Leclercia pneumoniae]
MKVSTLTALLVTTYIGFDSMARASAPQPVFTPEQEAKIGEIAAEYLVAHPEVLVAVSQKLHEQQEARQQLQFAVRVMDNHAALLNDADTPAFGPENARVAVIEFFDYQCIHCSSVAPELEKIMKTHPDVRYVFKEWPIFADRWENSQTAAERGLSVWKQKGAEAYVTYHNAIYATGNNEGDLTKEDIDRAAAKTGWHDTGKENFTPTLEKNDALARTLGLTGTPGIVVMPVTGATPKNITVLPGAVPAERLEAAIQKASASK